MDKLDVFLGLFNFNKMVVKLVLDLFKVLVFDVIGDEGFSVCKFMFKDGGFNIWGLVFNVDMFVVRGELCRKGWLFWCEVDGILCNDFRIE